MNPVRILVAEDQPATREQLCDALRSCGFEVIAAKDGLDATRLLDYERVDVVLSDQRMPRMSGLELLRGIGELRGIPVILYSAAASAEVVFRAGQMGAVRFLEYPFRIEEQLLPTIAQALSGRAEPDGQALRGADRLLGESESMRQVREAVRRVARSEVTVLISGETGTGKEVVARAIHEESGRDPFCVLAVTELAESLLEAELFGHERGAFTGAHDARPGLFEEADGGTLFLDEIGDAAPAAQAKLLRVIETGEVRRVGGSGMRGIGTRLLFATNRDLGAEVRANRFRRDLFYRLNQGVIHLPPLRGRLDDVEPLARAFLRQLAAQAQLPVPEVSAAFLESLRAQPWRGNVRELRSVVQRILLWWDGVSCLEPIHVAGAVATTQPGLTPDEREERWRMLQAFRHANGNQETARVSLGMSRAEWRGRWARFGLEILGRRRR